MKFPIIYRLILVTAIMLVVVFVRALLTVVAHKNKIK